jgi:alkaline phosphatase
MKITALITALALNSFGQQSAILFNVDGASSVHWTAVRWLVAGPDGDLHWDALPAMADYRGHMLDVLAGSSNAGCTVHAYGVKVPLASFGTNGGKPLRSASGKLMSIAEEAKASGKAIGFLNTSAFTEAGTGTFLAKSPDQNDQEEIARQMIEAEPDLLLGGGEMYLLPAGTKGRHGSGVRKDGRDLIARAKELGFTVVYTREELRGLADRTPGRVLGLFAADETLNRASEEDLLKRKLPIYVETAPSIAEMTEFALRFLGARRSGFLLVMNDEGPDNFSGANNAPGTLESMKRSDEAIGVLRRYIDEHLDTATMLVTADAPAGGLVLLGRLSAPAKLEIGKPLPPAHVNGAPIDGAGGTATVPFVSAPSRDGRRMPFAISWGSQIDDAGKVLVRSHGKYATLVSGSFDNTRVYHVLYQALFGIPVPVTQNAQ